MLFAQNGHVRIGYEVSGKGSPVLLIMGFVGMGKAWRHQIPDLESYHQVARYDHRGVGRSDRPPGPCSMTVMANDAVAVLDHLGWDEVHVVGVSMGGMIAQELALQHSDRVRSLTLIATHAGGPISWLPTLAGAHRFISGFRKTGRARLEALSKLLFPADYLRRTDVRRVIDGLESDFGSPPPKSVAKAQMSAVRSHDTRLRLHRLKGVRTLVVRPDQDILVRPRCSDELAKLIPRSELFAIAEAGHGMIRQCPEILNPKLLSHFAAAESLS